MKTQQGTPVLQQTVFFFSSPLKMNQHTIIDCLPSATQAGTQTQRGQGRVSFCLFQFTS